MKEVIDDIFNSCIEDIPDSINIEDEKISLQHAAGDYQFLLEFNIYTQIYFKYDFFKKAFVSIIDSLRFISSRTPVVITEKDVTLKASFAFNGSFGSSFQIVKMLSMIERISNVLILSVALYRSAKPSNQTILSASWVPINTLKLNSWPYVEGYINRYSDANAPEIYSFCRTLLRQSGMCSDVTMRWLLSLYESSYDILKKKISLYSFQEKHTDLRFKYIRIEEAKSVFDMEGSVFWYNMSQDGGLGCMDLNTDISEIQYIKNALRDGRLHDKVNSALVTTVDKETYYIYPLGALWCDYTFNNEPADYHIITAFIEKR